MHEWQKDMLNKISGHKKGELVIAMSGQRTGKSFWTAKAIDRLMRDLMNQPVEELVLNEGKIYGARYYTVEPIGGNWLEMEAWCTEAFGSGSRALWGEKKAPEPALRWYMNDRKFWFRDERDRTMFILRWR